jgi:hypothetical protein
VAGSACADAGAVDGIVEQNEVRGPSGTSMMIDGCRYLLYSNDLKMP